MPVFDQRNQKVTYQYNVNGTINFSSATNIVEITNMLSALVDEVQKASQAQVLDEILATDVEAEIKKAVIKADKPSPDKQSILEHLEKAKKLVGNIAALAGLVTSIAQAIELIQKIL